MSQSLATDFPINPTTTSGTVLAEILNRFERAIQTNNSGAVAPPSTYAGMTWLDTSAGGNGILKLRDAANAAWVAIYNTASPPITGATGNFTQKVTVATPAGVDAELWLQAPAARVAAVRIAANGQAINAQSLDLYQESTGIGHLNQRAAQALIFSTGGTERARASGTGFGVTGALAVTGAITATTTISATGNISGATVNASGNLTVAGGAYFALGSAGSPSIAFGADAGTGIFRAAPDILGIATSGVQRAVFSGGYTQFNSGTRAPAFTLLVDGAFGIYEGSGFRNYGWNGNSMMRFNPGNSDWEWISGGTNVMTLQAAGGNFLWRTGTAAKPGGGPWTDVSDARVKHSIADYCRGLDAVRALRPRTFHYTADTGRDPAREYVGLIAQEAAVAMPEMVSQVDAGRFPEFEGSDTLLALDATALTYALVNAVKELDERLATMERKQ